MRLGPLVTLSLLLLMVAPVPGPALAQNAAADAAAADAAAAAADAAPGRLAAYYCGTMPSTPTVEVIVLDNADVNLRIKDAFVAGLRRSGVVVQDGAGHTLTLEVAADREFEKTGERDALIELRVGQPDRQRGEQGDVNLRGSVWSSTNDSLVGGRVKGPKALAVNRVRLTASLNSRVDGHCLWQGEAIHELGERELEPVALVPALVGAFGKSVKPRPLNIETAPPVR